MSQLPITARLYARLGPRVVYVCLAAAPLMAAATSAAGGLWLARYLDLEAHQLGWLALVWMPVVVAAPLATMWWSRGMIRTVLTWRGAGRAPEHAAAVWRTATHGPYLATRRSAVIFSVVQLPLSVFTTVLADAGPLIFLPVALCHEVCILAGCGLYLHASELIVRPLLEDVARHLPDDFAPTGPAWRLRHRALAPQPILTCFAALTVGAYADLAENPARLAITLAIAVAIAVVAGAIYHVITRSALDPLDDLLAGVRRVQHGDLDRSVPVVTADDLGELAHNFNVMLAGLRERDSLRTHNADLARQLQASLARVVAAADDERRRMERDLHDGAQQRLVLIKLKLRALGPGLPPADAETLEGVRADVSAAIAELRDLAHGIYPTSLESDGLAAALQEAAQRAAIPVRVRCEMPGRYGRELEAAVYFCCLEALQNASKHAGYGARAMVTLAAVDGFLRFTVADDGAGFDPARHAGSDGLQNMRDRIGALGGTLEIESAPGLGATVVGVVPIGHPWSQYSRQSGASWLTSTT